MERSLADRCRSERVGVGSTRRDGVCRTLVMCAGLGLSLVFAGACNSFHNGWLDPTVLGGFKQNRELQIRTSLTLDDPPSRIPGATLPTVADLIPIPREFDIMGGDSLAIEINELRQRAVPFQVQIQVSPTGMVNLPVVGKIRAGGMTPSKFQQALVRRLQEKKVLLNPEVTVNPLFLQKATYTIFGIGVSASNVAPLRAGTFPIRRPDLRLLDAINQVGGLNEFVTEIYIFRKDEADGLNGQAGGEEIPSLPDVQAGDPDGLLKPDEGLADSPAKSPKDEVLEAVDDSQEVVAHPKGDDGRDAAVEMKPPPVDPYLFVDGKFIRNPAHPKTTETGTVGGVVSQHSTVIPASNWSRLAGDRSQRIIVVSADRLRSGDMSVNVIVRAGDVIRIVQGEIGVYYVMGQVNRVGAFAFNSEDITLKAAIAAAGGLSGLAWPTRCTIYRRIGANEQMVQVNLDRIFAGLDDDFLIRRGDIINIGTHPFAPFLQRIRGLTLPTPTTTVGYGFIYSRNFADIDSFAVQANPNNRPSRLRSLLGS